MWACRRRDDVQFISRGDFLFYAGKPPEDPPVWICIKGEAASSCRPITLNADCKCDKWEKLADMCERVLNALYEKAR